MRSSLKFCTSCGRPLDRNLENPGPEYAVSPPTQPISFSDSPQETLQGPPEQSPNARPASNGDVLGGLSNKTIDWFRNLSSVPKLILGGLLLLLLLTVLSPVARVVAIIAFVVSAIVLTVRAIQRGPIKGWGIAAVTSFVLIFVFGGISSLIYGSGFTSLVGANNQSGDSSDIGTVEKEYLRGTDTIGDGTVQLVGEQVNLYRSCDSYCAQSDRALLNQNAQSIDELLARTRKFNPPGGYEESHDALLSAMDIASSITSLTAEETINDSQLNRMIEEENDYFRQSRDLLPASGRSYYDRHLRYE